MSQKVEWSKVVSIEPDGEEECVCIAVADGSRLYATGSGILTHNTTPPAPTGLGRQYVAVTGALDNLREGMKLVKSTDDERTMGGTRVADTQYQPRTFEDMKPLAEAVLDGWVGAEMSGPEVLGLLRTGDHSESGQRLEPGERILISDGLIELKALETDGSQVRCSVICVAPRSNPTLGSSIKYLAHYPLPIR
jgi:hypothetical protein